LRQDLPPNLSSPIIGIKPEGSKVERMVAQSAKIESGYVHLLRHADWLDAFLLELLAFPSGRHDDQVDSVSQFLKWAAARRFYSSLPCGIGIWPMPDVPPDFSPTRWPIIGVYDGR
jgi:hypothetical protein